jgi:hypothetical protein
MVLGPLAWVPEEWTIHSGNHQCCAIKAHCGQDHKYDIDPYTDGNDSRCNDCSYNDEPYTGILCNWQCAPTQFSSQRNEASVYIDREERNILMHGVAEEGAFAYPHHYCCRHSWTDCNRSCCCRGNRCYVLGPEAAVLPLVRY